MANTETRCWVVTSGKSWLAATPLYSTTATKKDSMPLVVEVIVLKSELALLAMTRTSATRATLWLDLVQEDTLMAQNLVETGQSTVIQIMDTRVSKPWGTYWCNKTTLLFKVRKPRLFHLGDILFRQNSPGKRSWKSPKYTVTTHLNY